MSTTSQTNNIVNQSMFEEQNDQIPTQMGFIPFPANLTLPPLANYHHQFLKPFNTTAIAPEAANFAETLLSTTSVQKPREDLSSNMLSMNRSRVDSW